MPRPVRGIIFCGIDGCIPDFSFVILGFSLLSFSVSLYCHSHENGNPGQMKSLCPLDLRVKPEDDRPTPIIVQFHLISNGGQRVVLVFNKVNGEA